MTVHPRPNEKGKPVPIHHPHQPSPLSAWDAPDQVATVVPDGMMPQALNKIDLNPWRDAPADRALWTEVPGTARISEPPFDCKGLKPAAGVVIMEPDGRVWLVAPTNAFGGYRATFPKGRITDGLDFQATAIKETLEESGLKVMIF